MLCAEDRIDTAFFPYEPKSLDGMIHNDHLATPQKMTDSSGAVVWAADYKPFGEATITVSTITNNLRFPGQYYDAETGLNYNYYRDYNPVMGRYIEKDPIGLRGGMNPYWYVQNNPVNWIDPFGLQRSNSDKGQFGPVTNAIGDFLNNYQNMRDANTIGADKYFHCMANCQAAKEGPVGKSIADIISEGRELFDEYFKGDSRSACDADRAANIKGRDSDPNTPCSQSCDSLRPNGLDPRY
jgi:RHS repeat-associated protein